MILHNIKCRQMSGLNRKSFPDQQSIHPLAPIHASRFDERTSNPYWLCWKIPHYGKNICPTWNVEKYLLSSCLTKRYFGQISCKLNYFWNLSIRGGLVYYSVAYFFSHLSFLAWKVIQDDGSDLKSRKISDTPHTQALFKSVVYAVVIN